MPPRNLLIIAIAIIASVACYSVASRNRYANIFAEALTVVENRALQSIPRQELFNSAMDGLTSKLDRHSAYLHGDQYKEFNESIQQHFGGLGVFLGGLPKEDRIKVRAAFPGSPADEAGILPGDQIVAVDGQPLAEIKPDQRIVRLKGDIGQPVMLTILRDSREIEITVERADIEVPSVRGDRWLPNGDWIFTRPDNPKLGYVRIVSFGRDTPAEFEAALEQLDGNIEGLIIDLRGNAGGLLSAAVELCDMLLPTGSEIVTIKTRQQQILERPYVSETDPLLPSSIPLVVLIDRYSASASEITAGCLQDHNRAVLIGEQSWGKGTVQDVLPIEQGESALKLTTSSYWRPSGKNIDRDFAKAEGNDFWGVQPDEGLAINQSERTISQITFLLSERELRELTGGMEFPESLFGDAENDAADLLVDDPNTTSPDKTKQPQEPTTDPTDNNQAMPAPVDLPLERAIEHLKSLRQPAAIAA